MDESLRSFARDRWGAWALVGILVVCAAVALNGFRDWLTNDALRASWDWWSKDSQTAPRDLVFAIGGFFTLSVAVWRTWINGQQAKAQKSLAEAGSQSAAAALRQSEIAWRGQLADRFIKTAPLLGREEINERIGALIALEEIAKHSEEHRWSIIELIASFIRESVTIGIKPRPGAGKILSLAQTDVAHALDVIGRLNRLTGQDIEEINLSSCNFKNYVFSGNFSKAALNRCILDSVLFKKCQLFGTSLVDSRGVVQFQLCNGRLIGASEEWNGKFDGTQNFAAQIGLEQESVAVTARSKKVRSTIRRKARRAPKRE